jgi:hypothetical protein
MSDQNHPATDGVWTTFAKQAAKNTEKQPGWVYLLAVTFVVAPQLGLPSAFRFQQWSLSVPNEVWATIVALVAYSAGDALDKITFKTLTTDSAGKSKWVQRYKPTAFNEAKKLAEGRLGIKDGLYNVSMKVLEAAHDARFSVHWVNEIAKFMRSALVLVSVVAVLQVGRKLPWGLAVTFAVATLAAAALLLRYVYPIIKTSHITSLYESILGIADERDENGLLKLEWFDAHNARLFFWEGLFVASAKKTS